MNYPSHILDRPSAVVRDFSIHETDLAGRNLEFDKLSSVLDAGSDQVLRRDRVDLLQLGPWLPRICLHDFIIDDDGQLVDAIVRFQGPEIGASYSEITGKSMFTHPEPDVVERTFSTMKRMFELGRPITSSSIGVMRNSRNLRFQSLFIPLSSNGTDVIGSFLYASIEPSLERETSQSP